MMATTEKEDVQHHANDNAIHVAASVAEDVPTHVKYQYLALYFALNLGLTIYNKVVMGAFPFPWSLTAIHAACGSFGCLILLKRGYFTLSHLDTRETWTLHFFSLLYTINIAISNVSLNLVTVPFHQVVRATTPVFTVLIYIVVYQKTYATATYASLVPVIIGVGFATYGDYYCTPIGFLVTLAGAILAAFKTVFTNQIQTGRLKLPALEILYRMSPLACIQSLLYGYVSGELTSLNRFVWSEGHLTHTLAASLLVNGLLAFGLNVISFVANKKTGALTMTVAANVKQTLAIVLSVAFFHLKVGLLGIFGILLTLIGGAWYAKVELEKKGSLLPIHK